ncbi:unnamed protein product [Trifolium pratense]|uniref:Uncharacterized protein n=1 Tax=Trifolium pratense TaxID=57577 RepID=A0ACB0LRC6_TRIPR|nr:unnamed protein product [Trifolium pratense]
MKPEPPEDKLKIWNKDCFGNVHNHVISAEQKLHQIQIQIQHNGHTEALLNEEKLASAQYEDALNRQEVYWKEKARVNWHLEGDRNTKYFHRIAKIKSSTKFINSLQDEAANLLHNKSYGGNLALKIDITKAFDTLDWSFLLKVLKTFGFNEMFCHWIHVILKSAFLSVSFNGKSHGYFNCTRGVRQGDPLSPLLFCLAEDVLSRSISNLVTEGKINLIKGTRNVKVPSHTFYADDLMIFCKGNLAGLKALKDLFSTYALESGQVINNSKSTIFSGSITQGRLNLIVQLLNFNIGTLPFNYLGVPIFKGKPKASYLQPIADKIKLKLSAWKASLLSIAGRVQLVRSVIQSMLTYITTSWKKICRPLSQGGLNLRSLSKLNKATNLKLCWNLFNSQTSWAILLRDRVFRKGKTIQHHIFSSIWSSIKDEFAVIMENTIWLLGNGEEINFWNDNWCGAPLAVQFNIPFQTSQLLSSTVSDYIFNGQWNIPPQLSQAFDNLTSIVHQVIIPMDQSQDKLLWKHTDSGDLELKEAYQFKMQQYQDLHWAKIIWSPDIPPSKSLLPLGVASSVFAELCGAMRAIEIAYQKNWRSLWLESDSTIVVSTFNNPSKPVSWALRNRWKNVLFMISQMNCIVTHIFREGNQ